ncbi:hypothetical protein [Kocuria rhizosphaericola]|uniref:hypothetical protein n=1 Tax=Kocuria rhizosphaericola TaxID=3376284 RepID=UPI0037A17224
MADIRTRVAAVEDRAQLPPGQEERFSGYGVMGLPFRSGHVLALRRFPVTSVGPGYTSVWWRDPAGAWTMWTDADPGLSCPRYFGRALSSASVHRISIDWSDERSFTVTVGDGVGLVWEVRVGDTPLTQLMSGVSGALPQRLWRGRRFLRAVGAAAGPSLRAGRIGLVGEVPNGQSFRAAPRRMWFVQDSRATLGGADLGPIGALTEQARLRDFWIPQRGIFMIGSAVFEPFDPARHVTATSSG